MVELSNTEKEEAIKDIIERDIFYLEKIYDDFLENPYLVDFVNVVTYYNRIKGELDLLYIIDPSLSNYYRYKEKNKRLLKEVITLIGREQEKLAKGKCKLL